MTALSPFVPVQDWRPSRGALHGELTADGERIVLIAAGDDWQRSLIAARLDKITALWTSAKLDGEKTGAVTIPLTWANVVQLGYSFAQMTDAAWVPHERLIRWTSDECARRYAPLPELEASWPPWLKPRDYQLEGARQIAANSFSLLLDDPGLGKTLTVILGCEQRRRLGTEIFPMAVLVPSWDVADVWYREITTWAPSWGEPAYYEGPGRFRLLRHPGVKVLLTTYATATRDAPDASSPLPRFAPRTLIVDEAHMIKNADAKRSKATERIGRRAATVVGLSGTLITRDTGDAFPILKTGDPDTWPARERFVKRFCATGVNEHGEEITGLNPYTAPEFRACLLGQMTRRPKADVLPELPPKIYSVRRPEIPPGYRQAYRQMEQDMLAALPGNDDEMSVMDTLSQLTRLSQLASSAADVEWTDVQDPQTGEWVKKQKVTLRAPSWKAASLLEILEERRGDPVAVFTVSEQLARITGEDYLAPHGYRFGYVTGIRRGMTRRGRAETIERFQAGELDAVICTTGAGGLGITLSRAGTVVMLQRPWPLDQAVQSEDRAQRIGAEEWHDHIEIIDVVAKGTVDERVRELLRVKAGRLAEFVRDRRIVEELLGGNR